MDGRCVQCGAQIGALLADGSRRLLVVCGLCGTHLVVRPDGGVVRLDLATLSPAARVEADRARAIFDAVKLYADASVLNDRVSGFAALAAFEQATGFRYPQSLGYLQAMAEPHLTRVSPSNGRAH